MPCIGNLVERNNSCEEGGVVGLAIARLSAVQDIEYSSTGIPIGISLKAGERFYAVQGDSAKGTFTITSDVSENSRSTYNFSATQIFDNFSREIYNALSGYSECCNRFIVVIQLAEGQIILGPRTYKYLNSYVPVLGTGVNFTVDINFGTFNGDTPRTMSITYNAASKRLSPMTDGLLDFNALAAA